MADEPYWTHRAATPTPTFAEAVGAGAIDPAKWTEAQWTSFSPGMRREIVRMRKRKEKLDYLLAGR